MKKRLLFLVLVFVCLSGIAVSQTIVMPKHPTPYDKLREAIYAEKANSNDLFQLYLKGKGKEKGQEFRLFYGAPEKDIKEYQAWLWERISKIKLNTIKLGGNVDFGGKAGTTFSFNPGFAFELIKIFNIATILLDFNARFKRDDKITSFEATAGAKIASPMLNNILSIYGKLGIGPKFPSGGDPTSAILNMGPGISFMLDKKATFKVEGDALFYWATNPIFNDGDLKKKHDTMLSISITYTFAGKKII